MVFQYQYTGVPVSTYWCSSINILVFQYQYTGVPVSTYWCSSINILVFQYQHTGVPVSTYWCSSINILVFQYQHTGVPVSTYWCSSINILVFQYQYIVARQGQQIAKRRSAWLQTSDYFTFTDRWLRDLLLQKVDNYLRLVSELNESKQPKNVFNNDNTNL